MAGINLLECPICGFNCSHIQRVYTRMGADAGEAEVYAGTGAKGRSGWRRSALVVEFEGECGHNFAMVIQQHKGENYIIMERIENNEFIEIQPNTQPARVEFDTRPMEGVTHHGSMHSA
jgi:hypothetical protein